MKYIVPALGQENAEIPTLEFPKPINAGVLATPDANEVSVTVFSEAKGIIAFYITIIR